MSSQDWNDPDPAENAWKRSLLDARHGAREALAESVRPEIDNWQAIDTPQVVQYCHAKTMDYYRHIAPKAAGLPSELWSDPVTEVRVPDTQQIDAGLTDWYGRYELDDILDDAERTEKPVALDTLREEWQENATADIEVQVENRATGETEQEYRRFDLYLPPAACDAVIQRLDECLENLNWLPESGEYTINSDQLGGV